MHQSRKKLLTKECSAQELSDILKWLNVQAQCRSQIRKYNCQDNTVTVDLEFNTQSELTEFQLRFT